MGKHPRSYLGTEIIQLQELEMCDIQADIDQGNEYPVLDTEATAIMLKDKDDVDTDDSIIVDTKEKSHSEDSPYKLTHLEEVAEAAEAEENNFFSQHSS